MTTGLCFQNSLQNYLLGENRKADIYTKILNNISFDETKNPTDLINDLTGLISVEAFGKPKAVGVFNPFCV